MIVDAEIVLECKEEEVVCEAVERDGKSVEECKCPESNDALECESSGGIIVCEIEIDEDEKEIETRECVFEVPECPKEEQICTTEIGPDGE